MVPVNIRVHELSVADGIKSRCRIYSIPKQLTSFRDQDIEQYGTLWTRAGESDSNSRVTEQGIKYTDYFNKDRDLKIGTSTCSSITFSLMNEDHYFDNVDFGRIYVYLDVWDEMNSVWRDVPLGAFDCDTVTNTTAETINVTANDMMQTLELGADYWFNNLIPWTTGVTLYDVAKSLADQFGYSLRFTSISMLNGSFLYEARPFYSEGNTYRKILEYIAELAGGNAFFDHEGRIDIQPFKTAEWRYPGQPYTTVTIDGDSIPSNLFKIDIETYEIPQIWGVDIYREGVFVEGTTAYDPNPPAVITRYYISDNPLAVDTTENAQNLTPDIVGSLHAIGSYVPLSATAIMDFSVESGDIIKVVRNGVSYNVPIFQQIWTWRGGHVYSDFMSTGTDGSEQTQSAPEQTEEQRKLSSFESGFVPRRAVAAGAVETIQITYSKTYKTIPNVVASLYSNHTEEIGLCSAVVWEREISGFSLRLVNNSQYTRSLGACWIAMENYSEPQESDDPTLGVVGVGVVGTAVVGLSS